MPRIRKDGKKVINSRNKGAEFERKIANLLRARGFQARRGVQFHGKWVADVETKNFPFHIECKNVQVLQLNKAYHQSLKDCPKGKVPSVIHTKNREKIFVTIEFSDFLNVVQWAMGKIDKLNTLDIDSCTSVDDVDLI